MQRRRKLTSAHSTCQQPGIDFVPIILTARGGMGEQLQGQYWNSHSAGHTGLTHWSRVEVEDEMMTRRIVPWVARKRKALWQARFAVAVANCNSDTNARMISRSQHN